MALLICDTDFLIKVTNDPLPAFRDYLKKQPDLELATIPAVVRELHGLASNKSTKVSRRAVNALRSVGHSVSLLQGGADVEKAEADIALSEYARTAKESEIFIATLDGKLLSKFERTRLPYFTLRNDRPFVRSFNRATYLTTKIKQS